MPEFTFPNLTSAVSSALDKEVDQIVKDIQKQMPSKMMAIRAEIRNDFVQITRSVFASVFGNYYDDAFDPQSLQDSLIFVEGRKLYPSIEYNKKVFVFLTRNEREERKFNENAFEENIIDPGIYTEEDLSIMYGDYEQETIEYQAETEGTMDDSERIDTTLEYWNFTKANNNRRMYALSPLDSVYRIAKERTYQQFEKQFKSVIKPKILKKYGIKLG